MQADLGPEARHARPHRPADGDIWRRLDLGRGGPKVRKVEDGVVESLDKIIMQLEEEQQHSSSSRATVAARRPADASRPMGGRGAAK